jgi:chromosome segregation ATPase
VQLMTASHKAAMQAATSQFECELASVAARHASDMAEAEAAHKELVNAVRDSCVQEVTAAQRDAEAQRALAQQAEANILTLKSKVTQLQDRIVQQDSAYSELSQRHVDVTEAKDKEIAAITSENGRLQAALEESEANVEQLKKEFADSKAAWSADSARMCELYEAKCKALTDSMADLKARFKRELITNDSSLESMKTKLAGTEKQVNQQCVIYCDLFPCTVV